MSWWWGWSRWVVVAAAATLAFGVAVVHAGPDEPGHAQIIAGSEVSGPTFDSRWPFIALLYIGGVQCGGSVIDSRTVITAAHCVREGGVTAGANTITAYVGAREQVQATAVEVEQVVVHPAYNEATFLNDIALLHLSSAVVVTPISLVGDDQSALWGAGAGMATGADGPWVAGWGHVTEDGSGPLPSILREVAVPIVADATCAGTDPPGYGAGVDTTLRLCAGDPTGEGGSGADTCQGDSGGPLTVSDGAGGYRLVGLTSSGTGCGSSNYGLYTRVAAFRSWIEANSYGGAGTAGSLQGLTVTRALTSLTATWDAPAQQPDDIELHMTGPGAPSVRTIAGSATSTTISNLTPGASYTLAVLPWYAGDTALEDTWSGTTQADTAAPGRPGTPFPTARRRTSVTFSWSAASDNHRVSRYRVYRRIGTSWRLVVSPTTRTATIGSLRRGTRVLVAVRAVDPTGNVGALSTARLIATA